MGNAAQNKTPRYPGLQRTALRGWLRSQALLKHFRLDPQDDVSCRGPISGVRTKTGNRTRAYEVICQRAVEFIRRSLERFLPVYGPDLFAGTRICLEQFTERACQGKGRGEIEVMASSEINAGIYMILT